MARIHCNKPRRETRLVVSTANERLVQINAHSCSCEPKPVEFLNFKTSVNLDCAEKKSIPLVVKIPSSGQKAVSRGESAYNSTLGEITHCEDAECNSYNIAYF